MKIIVITLIGFILITGCRGLSDAGKVLRNEKKITTDEFLVKKRKPLVLPPDFQEIPKPESMSNNEKNQETNIKDILKVPSEDLNSNKTPSSTEDAILREIRK